MDRAKKNFFQTLKKNLQKLDVLPILTYKKV
jgi:hypothetical protein